MLSVLVLGLTIAAAAEAPLPPPPPLLGTAPPVVAPPAVPAPAPPAAPAPHAAGPEKKFDGLASPAVVGLGTLAGCVAQGACVGIGQLVTVVTFGLCPLSLFAGCVAPLLSGYAAAYVGDAFGTTRGSVLGPVIVGYVGQVVAVGAAVGTFFVFGGTSLLVGQESNLGSTALLGTFIAPAIVYATLSLATLVAQPLTYELLSEEKRPGDDGSGLPGLVEPNHLAPKVPKAPAKQAAPSTGQAF